MGKPQFSTELADFNQAQIDAIETAVDEVGAAVQIIKNTDLTDLAENLTELGEKIDLLPVQPPYLFSSVDTEASNVIINVTGSGKMLALLNNQAAPVQYTIQIDGGMVLSVNLTERSNFPLPMVFKTSLVVKGAVLTSPFGAPTNSKILYTLD